MLLFSTILRINEKLTPEDFIRLVIEWNQTSSHPENIIPNIQWNGERNIFYQFENRSLAIEEYRNQNMIAVRYEKKDADGVIWDTDYVIHFNERKISIRLDRSYRSDAIPVDSKFSTPHFISLLIDRSYVQNDGDFPIDWKPFTIDEENLSLLTELMLGNIQYELPVVFVSKMRNGKEAVDAFALAKTLAGIAHVVVQKDVFLYRQLREESNGRNEFNGTVGIYYPNPPMEKRRLYSQAGVEKNSSLYLQIVRQVIHYANQQMVDTLFTWHGVNNSILQDRLKHQQEERIAAEKACQVAKFEVVQLINSFDDEEARIRAQAQEEANKMIESFDDDTERLQKQIQDLMRANENLSYENQGLRAKLDASGNFPVLFSGDEREAFPGEIKDIVLSTLKDALPNLQEISRRKDVITQIIQANQYQHLCEKKSSELKRLLNSYTGMTKPLRQELENLGFRISEDGKHYKLTYLGNDRYQSVIAKTPSDNRAGKNNVARIAKLVW